MTDTEKLELILKIVEKKAKLRNFYEDEDFNIYDYSGGNLDDAFGVGIDQGYGSCARRILQIITEKD